MRYYYDDCTESIITLEDVKASYDSLVAEGSIFPEEETFPDFLKNCLSKNGSLTRCYHVYRHVNGMLLWEQDIADWYQDAKDEWEYDMGFGCFPYRTCQRFLEFLLHSGELTEVETA